MLSLVWKSSGTEVVPYVFFNCGDKSALLKEQKCCCCGTVALWMATGALAIWQSLAGLGLTPLETRARTPSSAVLLFMRACWNVFVLSKISAWDWSSQQFSPLIRRGSAECLGSAVPSCPVAEILHPHHAHHCCRVWPFSADYCNGSKTVVIFSGE